MQFVLVFIDKFMGLVKPYVHYEHFDDGVDRGYAVRECSKRIIELGSDRDRLRDARQESAKLRQRIVGKGGGAMGFNSGMSNINEDAFYKRDKTEKSRDKDERDEPDKDRYRPYDKSNDKRGGEMSLAERLGIKKDKAMEKEDNEHIKKRTKEDQKEVDEVKKILAEMPGENMKAYMTDFDIFADDGPTTNQNQETTLQKQEKGNQQQEDLFDLSNKMDPNQQQNNNNINNMGMYGINQQHQQIGMQNNIGMGNINQQQQHNPLGKIGNISYNSPNQPEEQKKNDPFGGLESLI